MANLYSRNHTTTVLWRTCTQPNHSALIPSVSFSLSLFPVARLVSPPQEMMNDPVIAADGHTYERVAIEQWLETNDNSPMTNSPLNNKDLVPNHAVKAMIMDYKKRHA